MNGFCLSDVPDWIRIENKREAPQARGSVEKELYAGKYIALAEKEEDSVVFDSLPKAARFLGLGLERAKELTTFLVKENSYFLLPVTDPRLRFSWKDINELSKGTAGYSPQGSKKNPARRD